MYDVFVETKTNFFYAQSVLHRAVNAWLVLEVERWKLMGNSGRVTHELAKRGIRVLRGENRSLVFSWFNIAEYMLYFDDFEDKWSFDFFYTKTLESKFFTLGVLSTIFEVFYG